MSNLREPNHSADDCITELQNIFAKYPEKAISRDFFRQASELPTSAWTFHFGTFLEFKRAAGLVPSRAEDKDNSDTAKHASKDILTALEADRLSWGEMYMRPSGKRFQDLLVCSDTHDISCDPFFRRLFVDAAKQMRPAKIVLNGDIFDFPEWSKFNNDPRLYSILDRYNWVQNFIGDLREASPDSEIVFIEGNHEYRMCRKFAEMSPETKTWLSDIHGYDMRKWLGLDKFEVNYYGRGSLKAFNQKDMNKELSKNYYCFNNQLLFHHFPEAKNRGMPGASGHHHKHVTFPFYSRIFGPCEWHQMGSGHMRFNDYQQSMGEQWSNGFLICHVDTEKLHTQMDYIDCSHEHCVINGKYYLRTEEEKIFSLP